MLRSLAAMLCHRLPGYADALGDAVPEAILASTDASEIFGALFAAPLRALSPPPEPLLIIIDALDEIPRAEQRLQAP